MRTSEQFQAALRTRRTSIATASVLVLIALLTGHIAMAASAFVVGVVATLVGSWLDARRGGVPLLSRRQAAVAGLTMAFVLTVVAVALS